MNADRVMAYFQRGKNKQINDQSTIESSGYRFAKILFFMYLLYVPVAMDSFDSDSVIKSQSCAPRGIFI